MDYLMPISNMAFCILNDRYLLSIISNYLSEYMLFLMKYLVSGPPAEGPGGGAKGDRTLKVGLHRKGQRPPPWWGLRPPEPHQQQASFAATARNPG